MDSENVRGTIERNRDRTVFANRAPSPAHPRESDPPAAAPPAPQLPPPCSSRGSDTNHPAPTSAAGNHHRKIDCTAAPPRSKSVRRKCKRPLRVRSVFPPPPGHGCRELCRDRLSPQRWLVSWP